MAPTHPKVKTVQWEREIITEGFPLRGDKFFLGTTVGVMIETSNTQITKHLPVLHVVDEALGE